MNKSKYVIYIIITAIILFFTVLINHSIINNNKERNNTLEIKNDNGIDIDLLSSTAKEHDVILFTRLTDVKADITHVVYYTTSGDIKMLQEKLGIKPGKVRSLVFDDIDITYKTFEELNAKDILNWSIYGSENNISMYVSKLQSFEGYYVLYSKDEFAIEKTFPFFLCIILIAIMLLNSYFDAIYQKKEITIRVIHGDSAIKYICRNILFDNLIYLLIYFVLYFSLKQYTILMTFYDNITWLYIALCIMNCFAYFPLFKFSSREVIYGYQHTKKIVSVLFVVKTISTITVAAIITSMCFIGIEIGDFYKAKKFFESHKNYMALEFLNDGDYKMAIKNGDIQLMREYTQIEGECKNKLVNSQAVNCICIADMNIGDEYSAIYSNHRALDYLMSVIDELSEVKVERFDCIILVPVMMNQDIKTKYIDYMKEEFENVENYAPYEDKIKIISYEPKNKILCMQNSGKFAYLSEPAICISSDTKGKYNIETNYRNYVDKMLFETDSTAEINNYFKGTPLKIIGYDAYDKYKSDFHVYIALITAAFILFLLMIVYYVLITDLLIRFDYDLNSKELAIKKVLGYSILRKNRNMFLQSSVVCGIIIALELALALIQKKFSPLTAILLCVILFGFDLLLLSINIKRIEKQQLVKILKGGAL